MANRYLDAAARLHDDAVDLLSELISFESTSGNEGPVMRRVHERMGEVADEVQFVEVTEAIKDDPDYSYPVVTEYGDRPNVRAVKRGSGGGKCVILNTHLDVVPPSSGHLDPFDARIDDGVIYGRGACDAKGQVTTVWLLFRLLDELGVQLDGDIIAHLVIEEEIGGNGTVAMVRHGDTADACVVLEPTNLVLLPQVRGAVWFDATVYGQAGHSGTPGGTVSALLKAVDVIEIFTEYHDRILAESRGHYPLFDQFENPMPLTIGQLEAGDWPAQAPRRATLKGVLGLLPDRTKEQVMEEMEAAVRDCGDDWLAREENFEIEFTYRHDANVIPPDHPLVLALQEALEAVGREPEVSAMTASCDAWMYNNQLEIPTVVFGPGDLGVAHSDREQIPVQEMLDAAAALATFADGLCR
ncbi:MAG: M20/M25/M40 family metallo-hydrolase [Armatimonadota bacterium]|nr:M20/M25/M40 family metallo-hydrolase [Armatimonadota bacterium]